MCFFQAHSLHKWITCGLLWCFYQLFELPAPIDCRGSIGEHVVSRYISLNLFWGRNKLIYILNGLNYSRGCIELQITVNIYNVEIILLKKMPKQQQTLCIQNVY